MPQREVTIRTRSQKRMWNEQGVVSPYSSVKVDEGPGMPLLSLQFHFNIKLSNDLTIALGSITPVVKNVWVYLFYVLLSPLLFY